ncbi:hypothetical protein N7448_002644 [Penicillium atrosanguineum]|uniref:Insertion element IS150 protein InsJ-like helix-turn-helix domain-containing protein n=1 Tax=Penicillium atrosanguineum TaxID=1132637 RepID=A0A9W9HE79_9EURO|nr:uncharacterized protein N7443_006049 [Penicillium atrosanguineum]KAJ5128935.1 hypothetical protein N7526_007101 [Penicillium atrosanguineum]KAJ5145252.1 hypothetical protein N7448_002644 [Penicillium atrosanguineum]KAJ5301047.1 hypothetical protein N7443_006049 [Penicillium atrosanguineum]KAJ5311692.1 hypothetical protein N7476_007552 [Penicillium atrosanguineum]
MARNAVDIKARIIVLALKANGSSQAEIIELTGLSKSTIKRICARAVRQGFDPEKRPIEISDSHLVEGTSADEASPKKQQNPVEPKPEHDSE